MRVLAAPDKFRGSLDAATAAAAMARGVRTARPDAVVDVRPVADGGEGTVAAYLAAGWRAHVIDVSGPTGAAVRAAVAIDGDRAVLELAECCGLQRLPRGEPAPMTATTAGLGEGIRRLVHLGVERITVGLGGSASTDGGVGMLGALGVRLRDERGALLPPVPASLPAVAALDVTQLEPYLPRVDLRFACDVTTPLVDAARVFGPQKGATAANVQALERGLARWGDVLAAHCGHDVARVPSGGAAGGVVAGALGVLAAVCEVQVASGAQTVLVDTGALAAAHEADLVIVGEGSLDAQSLAGKAPVALAAAAGRPVVAVAGRVGVDAQTLRRHGIARAVALVELAGPGEDPMRDAEVLVERAAALLVADQP